MNAPAKNTYLPFTEIKEELYRRRENPHLKRLVEEFLGDDFPAFLRDCTNPVAVVSRSIFSPNMEMRFMMDMVSSYRLEPLLLEYPGKFVSVNPEKLHLAKLRFFNRTKKGAMTHRVLNTIDFHTWEGKPMNDVTTMWNEKLIDFHHQNFHTEFPGLTIHDITAWFNTVRKKYGDFYYLGYLSLGIYHGVMFENYLFDNQSESQFFAEKIEPSIKELERIFGVRPLIHPILPLKSEADHSWLYYPENTPLHAGPAVTNTLEFT